ncbi:hypothetical protein C0995_003693 [Termitomyces sp. Mi166|nr:hypothetical protein C0995_003693 [Termitomyces sp. Mi166\
MHAASTLSPMLTLFDQDSWSSPTTLTNTSTAALLPSHLWPSIRHPACPSSALALASKAPPSSLKTPITPTSQIPQRVVRSTSNAPLAIPLAWELPPTDGQACCYECTLKIPDSLVLHVIGHQGRGLKQAHNLSSSWLATFAVGPAGNEGRWFVTIRSTDQQIGEALVVIGKRIAKRQVHAPWKQKTGNTAPGVAALALSPSDSGSVSSTPKPPTQQT